MPTPLRKPVTRETVRAYDCARGRRLVVTLEPGDVVTIREKGRRKGFSLSLEGVYYVAVEADVKARKREAKRAKIEARKGGKEV
jgi:hypothetical protein